eukprot:CCRYP_010984-RA/>CCRYP_010984-RA protein AED:0.46 eAED:0.55 QI:0/0/0/1/0/0/3/0/195
MHVVRVIMVQQYTIQKGLKLFGKGGRKAKTAEITQMHEMVTYKPMHAHEFTREQRVQALSSGTGASKVEHALVEASRGITLTRSLWPDDHRSNRCCGDKGHYHAGHMGDFLHADLDEDAIMVLRGKLAELMAKVEPKLYRPYIVTMAKGESILYGKMQKAMYGLLCSVLLFYLKLRKDLEMFWFCDKWLRSMCGK